MVWQAAAGFLAAGRPARRGSRATIDSNRFGRSVAIGSGAAPLVDQISKLDGYRWGTTQPPDGDEEFPESVTLGKNLWLLANVYWKEFASPTNLFEAWGGAYDLVYQDAHKHFRYLDSYTIFIRSFDPTRADGEIELVNVLKYERRASASVIAMTTGEPFDWFSAKDITASDDPVSLRVGGKDFTMDSTAHVTILTVAVGIQYLAPIIQIDGLDPQRRTKPSVFTEFDEEGHLRFAFHGKHDSWLTEQATSYYRKHAHLFE